MLRAKEQRDRNNVSVHAINNTSRGTDMIYNNRGVIAETGVLISVIDVIWASDQLAYSG